ncbi:flagellar hook-basal body protein [Pseudogracilibacillus sp. SE30717A]|uniref:flagellar hook-basal body protein n=1 Tax=Pseudogracilibacillus sp. SE30717A TaxID=3098293 RepID=UPI00300E573C
MSLRTMGQAAVTMNQLQHQMDMIGHNLANSQTTGYKSRQAEFSNLLTQQINNMSNPDNAINRVTPDGIRIGTGARLGAIHNNLSLGSMQKTGRDLDTMLLNENHFYQIMVDGETHYTRDGAFYLQPVNNGAEVVLVTQDGYPVNGVNGPIQFEGNFDAIQIDRNGAVIVRRGDQNVLAGTIAVAQIERPRSLEAVGDNLFRIPQNFTDNGLVQQAPLDGSLIESGSLEMSNVSIQEQMTQLINAQRSYQFNSRTISMADQMQGLVNQLR